jgi:tetratricopeptide (TPR) repeat protein
VEALEALGLYEQALRIRRTGDLLRKAGTQREQRGDADGAATFYREALLSYTAEFGSQHPKMAVVWNDLGLLAENSEKFKEAETLYRRALAVQEKAYGGVHPEVGTTLNNLGNATGAQGRWKEAEPLLRRALRVLEQTLGPRNRRVAACAANLASLLAALDRRKEALALYRRAVSIYEADGDSDSARQIREAAASLRQ